MKKIILCVSLLAVSSLGYAQTPLTTGGKSTLAPAQCLMITTNQTAVIQLSADVVGAYDCTAAAAGVSTAHPKGKGRVFGASSNGGKIRDTATFTEGDAAAAAAAVLTEATTSRDAS